ncbi:hypothetical protein LOTGIDRAFT_173438 [Lottia gigantea]|uniref:Hexosyltransferase n=1 Tax=Lottia gigantea TaxID=225164 RepID=V4B1E1_LOTGI|nr:hypothetical protein LOTGIDRAFT_173438 [Lottia gigantea]ESP00132.1 hypothetical protein LOTGIDRAFT_173438 [Lottia gigantea]
MCVAGYILGCTYRLYSQNYICFDVREEENEIVNNLLMVAVKSTRRYLIRYGDTIMKTWGSDIPGHVLFFLNNKPYKGDLPVITLSDVHNGSTSVEKTFSILKTLSAAYSKQYEWFLIIEDQTFVHPERLESFLRKVNSRKNWYMGRLMKSEWYCESETGILLSRHAVNMIVPHLDQCVQKTESTEDDVVLGSCIKQYLDISCTGSVEFGEMFVNNRGGLFYSDKINSDLAFLIHPILRPTSMYQWARYFQNRNAVRQRIKLMDLQQEILLMNFDEENIKDEGSDETNPDSEPEVDEYGDTMEIGDENEVFNDTERDKMDNDFNSRVGEDDYPYNFWTLIQNNSNLHARNTHKAARKAVHSLVSNKNWILSPTKYIRFSSGRTVENIIIAKNDMERTVASFHTYQKYTEPEVKFDDVDDTDTIWVILPLFKKVRAFRIFLDMFADAVAKYNGQVHLRVVLNVDVDGEWKINRAYARQMQDRINLELIIATAKFDRGTAKALGTRDLPNSSLLVFIDVDIYMDKSFLTRVRWNTIYNRQVYFPICFSQYHPKIICFQQEKCQINVKNLENRYGFWRDFGYGMVSMYKVDYQRVGGFDLTIKGWGYEDVDLNSRSVFHGLTVFRAVDPSLVHIYHKKQCAKSLPTVRRYSCLMSDKMQLGYVGELSKIVESIQNTKTK